MNGPQDDLTDKPSDDTGLPLNFEAESLPRREIRRSKLRIPLICLTVLALGAASYAGLAYYLTWWPFVGLGAELKYLPDDCTRISSERNDQFRKTRFSQALKEREREREQRAKFSGTEIDTTYGVKDDDIERVTSANSEKGSVTIVTTKKTVNADEVKEGLKTRMGTLTSTIPVYTEETIGNYKLYIRKTAGEFDFGTSFCIPESKILLLGEADTIRKILQRNKKPEFSARMKKAYADADFSKTEVVLIAKKDDDASANKDVFGLEDESKHVEWMSMHVNIDTTVTFRFTLSCKDAAGAEEVRKKVEEKSKEEKPKESEKDKAERANLKVAKSGSMVIVTTHFKEQLLIDDLNKNR